MPFWVSVWMFTSAVAPSLPVAHAATLTPQDLQVLATNIAQYHHLNVDHFINTINCESGFDPNIIGDQGRSYGIAQIFLPAHTDISKEQALDPTFSLQWMAGQWENNKASLWSCWRNLGYGG